MPSPLNVPIPGIDQYHNSRITSSATMQEWETTQNGCKCALCTMDDASYFLVIRLGPRTSECEKNVTVVFAVTGCDVTNRATTLHGFNKHASSRREAGSDSRGLHRCTEKNSQIYAGSHVSIVPLVRFTNRSACNSSSSLVSVVPAARRTRLSEISPHPKH